MRPILAEIPAFPSQWLLPTIIVAALIGLFASARLKNATPLVFAAGLGFVAWLWSRQDITLHSYGFFLVIGFFLSVWLACLEAKRRGYDPNIILDLSMPLLLLSIVLCRVLYFLVYPSQWRGWGEFLQNLERRPVVSWRHRGRAFNHRLLRLEARCLLRHAVRHRGTGQSSPVTRLGDWAVFSTVAATDSRRACRGRSFFSKESNRLLLTDPSHPAQLYSTGLSLVLFGVMWWARKEPRFNQFAGQLTILLLALYGLERAFVEFFRRGATAPLVPGMEWITRAQLASVIAWIVLGVAYYVLSKRAARKRRLQRDLSDEELIVADTPSDVAPVADAHEPLASKSAVAEGVAVKPKPKPVDHVSAG